MAVKKNGNILPCGLPHLPTSKSSETWKMAIKMVWVFMCFVLNTFSLTFMASGILE